MKKLLFILSAIAIFTISCKKEETPAPDNPPVTTTQDANLMGTWAQDSAKADDGSTTYSGSMFQDTAIFTADYFSDMAYVNGNPYVGFEFDKWETSGDSIFCSDQGVALNRYKYTVAGNNLMLYLNNKTSADKKFWYHKVQ